MSIIEKQNRRSFIKTTSLGTGGLIIGFNWLSSCKPDGSSSMRVIKEMPSVWTDINSYLKIGDNGLVTIMSPNPEIGQNIKTSMPMIIAEELDVDWNDVIVEQAGLNTEWYTRQVAGGSQSIRQGWESLRKAGASARKMLLQAAANEWQVDVSECSVSNGLVKGPNGEESDYGTLSAEAAKLEIPEDVELKDPSEFKIIGKSKGNVDMDGILGGDALFGIDTYREGMLYAAVVRPPAFGDKLVNYDDTEAKNVEGVSEILQFGDKIAVLADNTWTAFKAKELIKAEWKAEQDYEDSEYHDKKLTEALDKHDGNGRRSDGDVFEAFNNSDEIFERVYEAPFLPHNCLEPMNFFAHVTEEKAELVGPIQTPEWTEGRVATLLEMPKEKIDIQMTRMGGGFGRRLYGDFALEAAEISQKSGKPVQLMFSRDDDMLAGTYRPASKYRFKAGIKDGELYAYHLTEACFNGQMFGQMPSNFPCGSLDHYRVDSNTLESNITTGAWRAPYANFLAFAEQAFIDELAYKLQKDPVDFRIELLEKAAKDAESKDLSYEPQRLIAVIKLAAEKSDWANQKQSKNLGFSAYYSHNTYVAEVGESEMIDGNPKIRKIYCAVDCGIVVNPTGALNQIEGGIIDGIGHAMYGDFEFDKGRAQSSNFNQYRMIRMDEAPEIETYFVDSQIDPTGLGEPALPPAGGAIANSFAAATGKRMYKQPFVRNLDVPG